MPRVTTHTKNRGGKAVYRCTKCGQDIHPGTRYFEWSRRFGRSGSTYRRHVDCGYPKPSELSSRKTATVEDAMQDARSVIAAWSPEFPTDHDPNDTLDVEIDEITSAFGEVADEADNVGQEYSGNADNMPEALQYGEQAEAMRAVGEELESWAQDLRDWEPDNVTVDLPDYDEADDREEYDDACRQAFDDLVESIREQAESAMDDLPEYQG